MLSHGYPLTLANPQPGELLAGRAGDGHGRGRHRGLSRPDASQFFALKLSHSDAERFQIFLDLAGEQVKLERQLLIMDNASWRKSPSLNFGRFEPVYLPAYSPDLSPIERLWKLMKAEWFSDFVDKSRQALLERIDQALRWVIGRTGDNTVTCRIKTKL